MPCPFHGGLVRGDENGQVGVARRGHPVTWPDHPIDEWRDPLRRVD